MFHGDVECLPPPPIRLLGDHHDLLFLILLAFLFGLLLFRLDLGLDAPPFPPFAHVRVIHHGLHGPELGGFPGPILGLLALPSVAVSHFVRRSEHRLHISLPCRLAEDVERLLPAFLEIRAGVGLVRVESLQHYEGIAI